MSLKKKLKNFLKKASIVPQEYEEDLEEEAIGAFFFNEAVENIFVSVTLPKGLESPTKAMLSYGHELCSFYKINKLKDLVLWMKSCKMNDLQLAQAKKILTESDYEIISRNANNHSRE